MRCSECDCVDCICNETMEERRARVAKVQALARQRKHDESIAKQKMRLIPASWNKPGSKYSKGGQTVSDCGVCVYSGCDDFPSFFKQKYRKAQNEYLCSECGSKINKGDQYEYVQMLQDGDWDTFRTCLTCDEIRQAFSCDGVMYGGMFWDSMEECFENLNTSCFNRLNSIEAKQELQRRWMEWKGLQC